MAGKLFALAAFSATADAAGTLSLNWADCGDSSTHGKVTGLTPASLTLGETTHTVGTGSLDEAVTGGSFTIDMEAGIIKKHWTGDVCTAQTFSLPLGTGSIKWDGMGCPLSSGTNNVPLDILLSSALPSSLAKATITVQAVSSSGDKLLCMKINTAPTSEVLQATDACPWATKCINSEKQCQQCNKSPFQGDDRCVCGPAQADWIKKGDCKPCDAPAPTPPPSPPAPQGPCSWATKCINSANVCQPCMQSPFAGDDRCVCGPKQADWIKKGECKACDTEVEAMHAVNGGTLKLAWKDCGTTSTHGKVSGLTPSTITLGQKTHTTGTGTLDEAVPSGSFAIDMKAGIIKEHWTGDICAAKTFNLPLGAGSVAWDGMQCPLAAGSISVPLEILLSSAIPSSLTKATISVTATAASGDQLLCMEIDTTPSVLEEISEIVV